MSDLTRSPEPGRSGYARYVQVPDAPMVYTSQVFPTDTSTDNTRQVESMFEALGSLLQQVGSDFGRLARLNIYVAEDNVTAAVDAVLAKRFGATPVAVTVSRSPIAKAGARVACDAAAVVSRAVSRVENIADATLMPAGGRVFVSGQAKRGRDFNDSVTQTMTALHDSLAKVAVTKADVVQVKAFIQPMSSHAAAKAEIERSYAGGRVPAIVITEWLAIAPTEIELIVAAPTLRAAEGADAIAFHWLEGMPVSPYYCRIATVAAGSPLIFIGRIDGGVDASPRDQWMRAYQQLAKVLRDAGSSFRHMAKATYFLADPAAREFLGEVRSVFYDPARPPAASALDVQSLGAAGPKVALDMIAVPMKRAPAPPAPK